MSESYSGAWKRRYQYFETPSAVQGANIQDHAKPGQNDDPSWEGTHTAPTVEVDPSFVQIGDEFWTLGYDSGEPGNLVDRTPTDHSHSGDHSTNEGAPQAQKMRRDTDVQGPGETYRESKWKGFGPEASSISHEARMRGINSQAQNNPPLAMYDGEGFRRGFLSFFMRGRDRRFLVKPIRTEHGSRPVYPNTAYIPPESSYDQNRPLGSSLASAVDRRIKRPMLRQTPPPLGDTIMEDSNVGDGSESIIGVF